MDELAVEWEVKHLERDGRRVAKLSRVDFCMLIERTPFAFAFQQM